MPRDIPVLSNLSFVKEKKCQMQGTAKEIIKLNNGPEINAGQVRWIEHGNRHKFNGYITGTLSFFYGFYCNITAVVEVFLSPLLLLMK